MDSRLLHIPVGYCQTFAAYLKVIRGIDLNGFAVVQFTFFTIMIMNRHIKQNKIHFKKHLEWVGVTIILGGFFKGLNKI